VLISKYRPVFKLALYNLNSRLVGWALNQRRNKKLKKMLTALDQGTKKMLTDAKPH
jgi:hypothetical protein